MEFALSIVSGIVSALLVSILYVGGRALWVAKLKPAWENLLYSDIRVDGEWDAKINSPEVAEYREKISIIQTGHALVGTITCTHGPDLGRTYSFTGTIRNSIVSGYFWSEKQTTLDAGAFALQVRDNGNILTGYTSYYFDPGHNLVSREYTWNRK